MAAPVLDRETFVAKYADRWTPDRLMVTVDPEYQRYRHSVLMGHQFRRLVTGIEPFQIWTFQPQIGKSTMASVFGPLWALDWYPDLQIILDSYAVSLSAKNGRTVRNYIRQNTSKLRVRLAADSGKASDWHTTEGGRCLSTGVDGQIIGNTGDLIVMDDPHKGWKDAQSLTKRNGVWDHYQGDVIQRGGDDQRILIIMTRWHPDDLVGRVLEDGSLPYHVLHVPAIADAELTPDGDPLGREDGEVVEPRRFKKTTMLRRKQASGPLIWNSQFQGNPRNPEGGILRRSWFNWRVNMPLRNRVLHFATSWDLSFTDNDDSSYVVGQLWAITDDDPHRFLLVDQIREQLDYPATQRAFQRFTNKHSQYCHTHLIERKANGHALIASMRELGVKGIHGIDPSWAPGTGEGSKGEGKNKPGGRKVAAATMISPLVASGRVELPGWAKDTTWVEKFLEEVTDFPGSASDDQVDAMTQALYWLDRLAERQYGRQATVTDELLFGRQ